MHMGAVPIDYFCRDSSHDHYKRTKVDAMIERGALKWHSKNCRVAYWLEHRTWQKTRCHLVNEAGLNVGHVAVMQLVKGLR